MMPLKWFPWLVDACAIHENVRSIYFTIFLRCFQPFAPGADDGEARLLFGGIDHALSSNSMSHSVFSSATRVHQPLEGVDSHTGMLESFIPVVWRDWLTRRFRTAMRTDRITQT